MDQDLRAATICVPPTDEPIKFGVPEQENFNTDRYFTEIIASFLRWLSLKRVKAGDVT